MKINTKTIWRVMKAGLGAFAKSAGGVAFVFGLVAAVMPVSLVVTIPVTIGFGLVCGTIGGYQEWKKIKEEEASKRNLTLRQQVLKEGQDEIRDMTKGIEKKVSQLVSTEQKGERTLQLQSAGQQSRAEGSPGASAHQDQVFINNATAFFVWHGQSGRGTHRRSLTVPNEIAMKQRHLS